MRKYLCALAFGVSLFSVTGCSTTQQSGPDTAHGFGSAAQGIVHLILSPFQIAAGLLEGVAAMPYYAATTLSDINQGMIKARAQVTLDDTYESAYGRRISQVDPSGDTGEVFRRMKHASAYFQKVLRRYGVKDASSYILTSIDTATDKGYTLFAVVYRPASSITVIDKYDGKTIRRFTRDDRLFYEPFQTDAKGNALDVIVDWAGIPGEQSRTQKQQAILLTLAANAVVEGRTRADYWAQERSWIEGAYMEIVGEQNQRVEKAMGI